MIDDFRKKIDFINYFWALSNIVFTKKLCQQCSITAPKLNPTLTSWKAATVNLHLRRSQSSATVCQMDTSGQRLQDQNRFLTANLGSKNDSDGWMMVGWLDGWIKILCNMNHDKYSEYGFESAANWCTINYTKIQYFQGKLEKRF